VSVLAQGRANAIILFGDTFFVQRLQQIAQAALKYRLTSIYSIHDYANVGGLMSYGADNIANFRRAANYVDKILNGVKAGELPFEQTYKIFSRYQPQDRQGAWTLDPTTAVPACGRGDQVSTCLRH
jgi:ABC-type uncharacterized transport system substrate-binding protein